MNENAIVYEIQDDKIKVVIENGCSESCLHCSQGIKRQSFLVHKKPDLMLKIGDRVEIYMAPQKTILAAFLIFIVPIILFFIFYFTGKIISGAGDELIPFFCGLGGIGAGFLLNFIIKVLRKQEDLPEIIKVYKIGKKSIMEGNKCNYQP